MNENKKVKTGFVIRVILTVILCILAYTGGAIVGVNLTDGAKDTMGLLTFCAIALTGILIALNYWLATRYKKSKNLSVREGREFITSRQEEAEKSLKNAVRKIVSLRLLIDAYSAFILLLGLSVAFCTGAGNGSPVFTVFPAYLILGFFNRIRLGAHKFDFSGYTTREEYPKLYELADKAMKASEIKGNVRIGLISGCNAGISKINGTYSLLLGVMLLDIMTEEELYQVLIHEFCHQTKDGNPIDREYRLFMYINEQEDNHINAFCNILFRFPDIVYTFEYMVYRTVASRSIEYIADRAIVQNGNPEIAASALTKLAYNELFNREFDMHVTECYYEPEEKRKDVTSVLCNAFRKALPERQEFWDGIISREIQPKSSSHPIVRDRIKAIGVDTVKVLPIPADGEYYEECQRAIAEINKEAYNDELENYAALRKEYYLEPLKVITEWKESGKELTPEEARPVMDALSTLLRHDELYELCDKLINEYDNKLITAHAYMERGRLRLLRYDKAGIEDIYTAMEANGNYVESGLALIGEFCCIFGLQDELDEYRERSIDITQNNIDTFSKTSTLEYSDNLIPDTMPREMLDSILDFMKNAGGDKISNIYLVRKQVTDDFFASVFVVRFEENTEDDIINDAMDKIFYHLDTRPEDWQFALHLFSARVSAAVYKVEGSCVYERKQA